MWEKQFHQMLQSMCWADERILNAVAATPAAIDALPILAHLFAAEHIWLARLQGTTPTVTVWPTLTLTDCQALAAANHRDFLDIIQADPPSDWLQVIEYQTSRGDQYQNTRLEILTQVVIHGAYHRGQLAKILGYHGVVVPNTDYITFLRDPAPLDKS